MRNCLFYAQNPSKRLFVFMTHLSFQFSILVLSDLFAALLDNTTHSTGPPWKCLTISTNLGHLLSTGILKIRRKGRKTGKKVCET